MTEDHITSSGPEGLRPTEVKMDEGGQRVSTAIIKMCQAGRGGQRISECLEVDAKSRDSADMHISRLSGTDI